MKLNVKNIIRKFSMLIYIAFNFFDLSAQCSCTNCPLNIPSNTTQFSEITISGASNPVLGVSGQGVCGVSINFFSDAIKEDEMVLIAPDGSSVTLMLNSGLNINQGITFEILFVPCADVAVPDPGFPSIFDTNAGWVAGGSYNGSYYPQIGCLEDLTGSVNGIWTLEITDHVGGDDAILFDWELIFCDDAGLGCNPESCDANGGIIDNTDEVFMYCENDPDLDFDISTDFGGNIPDPGSYGYTFIISDDVGNIIDFDMFSDLTSYGVGSYQICGFSYLIDDLPLIPSPGGVTISDIQSDIDNNVYCADIGTCFTVEIEPQLTSFTISGLSTVCAGQVYDWQIENINFDVPYTITITEGSFFSFNELSGVISISWASGPGEFCVSQENSCLLQELCFQVNVEEIDENFELQGATSVCNGVTENYLLIPNAPLDYVVTYTVANGTILFSDNTGVTVEWDNGLGLTGEICAQIMNSCGNILDVCTTVFIEDTAPNPTFVLQPEVCIGDVITLIANFSAEYLSYNWTVTNGMILSGQGTSEIDVDFTNASAGFSQVCLEVISLCNNSLITCFNTDIFNAPSPTIALVSEGCGPTATLEVVPQINNASIQWNQISGPTNLVFSDMNADITDVEGIVGGNYTIEVIQSIGTCIGSTTLSIDLDQPFIVSNPVFDCLDPEGYVLSIDISGGDSPYFVDGIELGSNTFTSVPIPFGTPYSFLVTDSDKCQEIIEGDPDCQCVSDAGSMDPEILEICENEVFTVTWNNDGFFDGNDIGVYILHEGSSNTIINPIAESNSSDFSFVPGMNYNSLYYISYVVGDDLGGNVDLIDNCLSVSIGQPVIFKKIPEITLPNEISECDLFLNANAEVDVYTTVDWTQEGGDGILTFGNSGSLMTSVQASQTGSYPVTLQALNGNCLIEKDILINFLDKPLTTDLEIICEPNGTEFTVSFNIESGSPPYFVNGIEVGDNVFNSELINSGEAYFFEVIDNENCSSDVISGIWNCNCVTAPGTMATGLLEVCGTVDSVNSLYNNDGFFDCDDGGIYILHDSPNNIIGNVFAKNQDGKFGYNANIEFNTIYYISYAIGTIINDTVDLKDPCLAISQGQPVVFYNQPIVNAGVDTTLCGLTMNLNGQTSNGQDLMWMSLIPDNGISLSDSLIASPQLTSTDFGNYNLILQANNGTCSTFDTVLITFNSLPEFNSITNICSSDRTIYDSEIIIKGNVPFIGNGFPYNSDTIKVTNIPSGDSLFFEIIDSNGCVNSAYLFENCNCTSIAGTMSFDTLYGCGINDSLIAGYNEDAVFGGLDTFVYIVYTDKSDPKGSLVNIETSNKISKNSFMNFNTVYYVSHATASYNNSTISLADICAVISNGQPIIFKPEPSIELDLIINECESTVDLVVNTDAIIDSIRVVSLEPSNSFSFINDIITAQDTGRFSITIASNNEYCTNTLDTIVILKKGPEVDNVNYNCDGQDYHANFTIKYGQGPFMINDSLIMGNDFISNSIPSDSTFSFVITDANGCQSNPIVVFESCNCGNDPGSLIDGVYDLCEGEDFLIPENNDYILNQGDVISYILYEGSKNNIQNILVVTSLNQIIYNPAYLDKTLFIKRVIGSDDGNGSVDFNSDCLGQTDGVLVTWHQIPTINFEKEFSICAGETLIIPVELSGDLPIELTYIDKFSNQVVTKSIGNLIDSIVVTNPMNGKYSIQNIQSEYCSKSLNDSFYVEVRPLPFAGITVSDIFICDNEIYDLDLSLSILDEDGNGTWINETNQTSISNDFQIVNLDETKDIIYVVENSCGVDTSRFKIIPLLSPALNIEVMDVICNGDENGAVFISNENSSMIDSITLNSEPVVLNNWVEDLAPGTFKIIADNNNSCTDTLTFSIFEPGLFEVDLGPDIFINSGESITINAVTNLQANEIKKVTWYLNRDSIYSSKNLEFNVNDDYEGLISVEIENLEGCITRANITISIEYDPIILPNVIRPGGLNNVFSIADYPQIKEIRSITIYDRWGNKVFNGSSWNGNLEWDGKVNGKLATQGVYIYLIEAELKNNEILQLGGDITLIH